MRLQVCGFQRLCHLCLPMKLGHIEVAFKLQNAAKCHLYFEIKSFMKYLPPPPKKINTKNKIKLSAKG